MKIAQKTLLALGCIAAFCLGIWCYRGINASGYAIFHEANVQQTITEMVKPGSLRP